MIEINIKRKSSKYSPITINKVKLPSKGILSITRKTSQAYAKTERYYFENNKFYTLKVMGNMNYNKQFPRKKPIVGHDDSYSIRGLK